MQQMKRAALEKAMTDLEPNNRLGIMLLICGLLFYNLALTNLAMAGEVWTPAHEGIDVSRLDRVTALVDAYVEDKKVPGMTVMVSRNGRLIESVTRVVSDNCKSALIGPTIKANICLSKNETRYDRVKIPTTYQR